MTTMSSLPSIQHSFISSLKLGCPDIVGIWNFARTAEATTAITPYPIIIKSTPSAEIIGYGEPSTRPIGKDEGQNRSGTATVLSVPWQRHGGLMVIVMVMSMVRMRTCLMMITAATVMKCTRQGCSRKVHRAQTWDLM